MRTGANDYYNQGNIPGLSANIFNTQKDLLDELVRIINELEISVNFNYEPQSEDAHEKIVVYYKTLQEHMAITPKFQIDKKIQKKYDDIKKKYLEYSIAYSTYNRARLWDQLFAAQDELVKKLNQLLKEYDQPIRTKLLEQKKIDTLESLAQKDNAREEIVAKYRFLCFHLHPDKGLVEGNNGPFQELHGLFNAYETAWTAFNENCGFDEDDTNSLGQVDDENLEANSIYSLFFSKTPNSERISYLKLRYESMIQCYFPNKENNTQRLKTATWNTFKLISLAAAIFAFFYWQTKVTIALLISSGYLAEDLLSLMMFVGIFLPLALVIDPIFTLSKSLFDLCVQRSFASFKQLWVDCAKRELGYVQLLPLALRNIVLYLAMPLALVLQLSYAACYKVSDGVSYLGSKLGLFSSSRSEDAGSSGCMPTSCDRKIPASNLI